MVLEMVVEILQMLSQMNTVLLVGAFFVFIVLAYKIFQALIKGFIVGVISAAFPIVANLMGMDVPLSINSIIWFAIFGVAAFLMYASITGGIKITKLFMRPFKGLFTKKPVKTIIIREKEPGSPG